MPEIIGNKCLLSANYIQDISLSVRGNIGPDLGPQGDHCLFLKKMKTLADKY